MDFEHIYVFLDFFPPSYWLTVVAFYFYMENYYVYSFGC